MVDLSTEEKYDMTQVEKLVRNIELKGDIRNLKVQNPDSLTLESFTLKDWMKWLIQRIQRYGDYGVEKMFISIIQRIDSNMQILVERAKESIRRVITVIDRLKIRIGELEKQLDDAKNEIADLKGNGTSEIIEAVAVPVEDDKVEDEVDPDADNLFPTNYNKKKGRPKKAGTDK